MLDGQPIARRAAAPAALAELIALVAGDVISGKIAKDVFAKMCASGEGAQHIVDRDDLRQISDEATLRGLWRGAPRRGAPGRIWRAVPRAARTALLGFFVGQLMKATPGARPTRPCPRSSSSRPWPRPDRRRGRRRRGSALGALADRDRSGVHAPRRRAEGTGGGWRRGGPGGARSGARLRARVRVAA
ncbi:MAG: hypothetical protein HS111_17595 [Kofleriaceae bacterium]|nr:hypothetical protein [Kofleriaceae bacterium]